MKTLREILGARNLCGVIEEVKGGLAEDILPPSFLRSTRTVEGDHCTYRKVQGTRKTARLVHYGSPSQKRNLSGISEQAVKLVHAFEHIHHNPTTLMSLQQMESETKQKLGMQEVSRQTKEFKQLFLNLRVASVFSALFTGHIYFDSEGNLLSSSSDNTIDINFGIPAGNQNQCDILGDGAIIDAVWSEAGTGIHTHIASIITAVRKLCGYKLTHAFYGASILDYFLGNTKLKELINRNTSLQASFMKNEIADGFLGVEKWIKVTDDFYVDKDGSYQSFMGSDKIIFTPTPSPEWYELIQGTFPVPTNIGNLTVDGIAAMRSIYEKAGMFSYAQVKSDPVSIKHLAGDTFLPVIKVPNAVVVADVNF